MLKIGKPGHRRIGQTPAEEARGLEDGIDALRAELCRRLPVQPQRQRRSQTGTALERRRSHNLHARYRSKRRKIGIIVTCPGEQDGRKFARAELAQRRKQIALIVVAAGPKPAGNMRKREAQRRTPDSPDLILEPRNIVRKALFNRDLPVKGQSAQHRVVRQQAWRIAGSNDAGILHRYASAPAFCKSLRQPAPRSFQARIQR